MSNTGPESTVPPAASGGGGARLRRAGAGAGEGRAPAALRPVERASDAMAVRRVRKAYEDMGVMHFAETDVGALFEEDNRVAEAFDTGRLDVAS